MKSMLAILLFGAISQAAPINVSKTDSLAVGITDGEVDVSVPADAKKALINWNPEFVVYNLKDYNPAVVEMFKEEDPKSVPMAFVADFDNNGEPDIALIGRDLQRDIVVALVQKDKKWTAIELKNWPIEKSKRTTATTEYTADKTEMYSLYIGPAIGPQAKKLGKKVGIQVETYRGPGFVYEIKDGKFSQVIVK